MDALAAGLDKGGENLLDKNDDGMLLVRYAITSILVAIVMHISNST